MDIQWFPHVLMRKQPTLLDSNQRWKCSILSNKTTESPWFPGLTPMSVMHSSLSRKCFQADPRAQACSMAATLAPQRTCHRRNTQAVHMRYRRQQCPASSKDQWHSRCKKMSLGSAVMQLLSYQRCHVQAKQAVTNPYGLLTSTSCMPAETHDQFHQKTCFHLLTMSLRSAVMQLMSCNCCHASAVIQNLSKLLLTNTNCYYKHHACLIKHIISSTRQLALAWACLLYLSRLLSVEKVLLPWPPWRTCK